MAEDGGVKGVLCRLATLDSAVLNHSRGRMNTAEESMHQTSGTPRFEVLDIALRAAGTAIAVVGRVPTKYRSLVDQVIRSASSVPAKMASLTTATKALGPS